MAVLCEGISVIVRRDSIDHHTRGGWGAFLELVPNATLCTDGDLARVGFMEPSGVEAFIKRLEEQGLVFFDDAIESGGRGEDIAVVDQLRGPTRPCTWIEFGRVSLGGSPDQEVSACWLFDGERIVPGLMHINDKAGNLHVPAAWAYEGSLSHEFTFVEDCDLSDRLQLLRIEERGIKVFRDRESGKEVYLGNPIDPVLTKH